MTTLPLAAQINQTLITLSFGNIVDAMTDAIVNAANTSLLGGGGVDGAIHRAAGPELLAECRLLQGCRVGKAKITKGYKLKARSVIHAVGPVYGNSGAPELLASAYTSSLELALEHGIRSIAFPAISTGAYGYPLREAALIALSTVVAFARTHTELERIEFILFTQPAFEIFQETLTRLIQENEDIKRR